MRVTTLLAISTALLCNFSMADEELPFKCPNKVPKDAPQPAKDINDFNDIDDVEEKAGLSPKINASAIGTTTLYAQFQAAIAIVPCDQEPISVFIPKTLLSDGSNPHDKYSVAAIYTDETSATNLKDWLKNKYASHHEPNPIRHALHEKQIPLSYDLSGDDILDALCPHDEESSRCNGGDRDKNRECCSEEKQCNEGQGDCDDDFECKGDLVCGRNNCGPSFLWYSADCCEAKGSSRKRRQAQGLGESLLSVAGSILGTRRARATPAPTAGPLYYKAIPEAYPTQQIKTSHHGSSYPEETTYPTTESYKVENHYPPQPSYPSEPSYPPVNAQYDTNPYHQPAYDQYTNYYDAPYPKFRVRIRTRRDFLCCKTETREGCQEFKDECTKLVDEGKFVSCNTTRFSDLSDPRCAGGASWLDCIEEDADYLNKIDFYGSCDDSDSECFSDRCRPADPSNPLEKGNPLSAFYPGWDAEERKPKETKAPRGNYGSAINDRHARDAKPYKEPLFTLQNINCRILQSANKDLRKRCDRIVETRPLPYKEAISLFPQGADLTTDEGDFDLLEFTL